MSKRTRKISANRQVNAKSAHITESENGHAPKDAEESAPAVVLNEETPAQSTSTVVPPQSSSIFLNSDPEVVVISAVEEMDFETDVSALFHSPFESYLEIAAAREERLVYDSHVIARTFDYIQHHQFLTTFVSKLESCGYLENFLLLSDDGSVERVVSVVVMVNEKLRVGGLWWDTIKTSFNTLFRQSLEILQSDRDDNFYPAKTQILLFLTNCFTFLDIPPIRVDCMRIVGAGTLLSLSQWSRDHELSSAAMKKVWLSVSKKQKRQEFFFLHEFIQKSIKMTQSALNESSEKYLQRSVILLSNLLSQLPTRRFAFILVKSLQLIPYLLLSEFYERPLSKSLVDNLVQFYRFEIDNETGLALSREEVSAMEYKRVAMLQRAVFHNLPLRSKSDSVWSNSARKLMTRSCIEEILSQLSDAELVPLTDFLGIERTEFMSRRIIEECLMFNICKFESMADKIHMLPLFPTEVDLWNKSVVCTERWMGDEVVPFPQLNLQFLSIRDYLMRNFILFQLESSFEIRQDVEDAIMRLNPRTSHSVTEFVGWSRMAVPLTEFKITHVAPPDYLTSQIPKPTRIECQFSFNLNRYSDSIRLEWDSIRRKETLFLVSIDANPNRGAWLSRDGLNEDGLTFNQWIGNVTIRGCEVMEVMSAGGVKLGVDKTGKDVAEGTRVQGSGDVRTLRCQLDPAQFYLDQETSNSQPQTLYSKFNILLRRKQKQNNFRSVLETIKNLIYSQNVIPPWIESILLGYGDPMGAHYSRLEKASLKTATESANGNGRELTTKNSESTGPPLLNFNDTFVSIEHLKASFPSLEVIFEASSDPMPLSPPATTDILKKLTGGTISRHKFLLRINEEHSKVHVTILHPKLDSPFPHYHPRNSIQFTPKQVEAIRSGMSRGLTMIQGPPGTGKTDVAVQIISNLYHSSPNHRVLLLTHSNIALNQLFEKITHLDINPLHLLRLGHGEEELLDGRWSKSGRVDEFLKNRLEMLQEVGKLAESIGIPAAGVSYSCETAYHFYHSTLVPIWNKFLSVHAQADEIVENPLVSSSLSLATTFPFIIYFRISIPSLFAEEDSAEVDEMAADSMELAHACWQHLTKTFEYLEGVRAFELLKSANDRANYLLVKQARVIAMTCTHAALKREELIRLGFTYDSVVVEESAQILEIESFIPLLLQSQSHIERVVLIGDHLQLPPVVQNMAFQKYCRMEQSMFSRFVRLGVPIVELDAQGRSRSEICALYKWRYKTLTNLPKVVEQPEYLHANPGFAFNFQLINVPDYMNKGETTPTPYYYQNLGEAEYVVAVYQYMRLIGYPAEKISILTTYNGQKALIGDVLNQRCTWNPMFGRPKIATVDKFQGQQNDYILLSLVRTRSMGHLRDVRRFTVAMSRARLGLYVFCRSSLLHTCSDLKPSLTLFHSRPSILSLVLGERYLESREFARKDELFGAQISDAALTPSSATTLTPVLIKDVVQMGAYIYHLQQAQPSIN